MPCVHLQQLVELCDREGLRLSSAELIHIVCHQCGRQEVCPSTLSEFIPEDAIEIPRTEPQSEQK